MSRFLETIRIEEGKFSNLPFHQVRFEQTRTECLGMVHHPSLEHLIRIPENLMRGLVRCRVIYGKEIEKIEFEPYRRRKIRSIRLVHSDTIAYPYKYADRTRLKALFDQRGSCDDILIVRKGEISDTYVANVVLWNGKEWHTPLHPLLPGTMRASLLATGAVRTEIITLDTLPGYLSIKMINAFHSLDEAPELGTDALI
jgi:4-amino-4-deoxychorismate lyase